MFKAAVTVAEGLADIQRFGAQYTDRIGLLRLYARTVNSDKYDESERRESGQGRDSRGGPIDPSVARDLSELAREFQARGGPQSVMDRIVRAAVAEIPGATGAAITLRHRGKISSPAHSDDRARQVGEAQEATGEGPCVDTSRDERTLRSHDLRNETRWPKWSAAAVKCGVMSVLSVQLFVEGDSMGALDVYSDQFDAFVGEAENIALLLASHAAIALADARKIQNMGVAIESRDLIGQAKGILMERYKINAADAFDLLVIASQRSHLKLREVAARLAETGDLFGGAP